MSLSTPCPGADSQGPSAEQLKSAAQAIRDLRQGGVPLPDEYQFAVADIARSYLDAKATESKAPRIGAILEQLEELSVAADKLRRVLGVLDPHSLASSLTFTAVGSFIMPLLISLPGQKSKSVFI